MNVRALLQGILFCWATLVGSMVEADQTSPELASLFESLQHSRNPQKAAEFEQKIWQHWLEGSSAEVSGQLQRAREAMSVGDLSQAEPLLDEIVARSPRFAEAWNQRALLRFLQNDYANSLADIKEALKLEPNHFGALSGRGQIHLRLNEFEDALAAFQAASAIHPWLADVQRNIEMLRVYLRESNRGI